MSYLATGSYGGRPMALSGGVVPDVTPDNATDFVKSWSHMKNNLRARLGEYKFNDGTLNTYKLRRCPILSRAHAVAIYTWAVRVGQKMIALAKQHGKPTGEMEKALATLQSKWSVIIRFIGATAPFAERLQLEQSGVLIEAMDNYAIDISTGQWASYNIKHGWELYKEALDETPGGEIIKGAVSAAAATWGVLGFILGNFGTILKLGLVGGAGYVGYRVYRKVTP